MKIVADVMKPARAHAEFRVNERFNQMAESHRDAAHKSKRGTAVAVMAGATLHEDHPFSQEAALRGLPVDEHARDIIAKPDNVQVRELKRQQIMRRIADATTPAELDGLLSSI